MSLKFTINKLAASVADSPIVTLAGIAGSAFVASGIWTLDAHKDDIFKFHEDQDWESHEAREEALESLHDDIETSYQMIGVGCTLIGGVALAKTLGNRANAYLHQNALRWMDYYRGLSERN